MRSPAAEAALRGKTIGEDLFQQVADVAAKEVDPPDDVYCTGNYKREMVRVLLPRVLSRVTGEK